MFNGFESSYGALIASCPSLTLITPAQMRIDPVLETTASIVDSLGRHVFSKRWPELQVRWGIEHADDANACVCRSDDGYTHIILTSGACSLLASIRAFVCDGRWLVHGLYPRLFDRAPSSSFSSQDAGQFTHLLGLAALFGHELGHAVDRHHIGTDQEHEGALLVAEEISADGHAILAGLAIVDAWAIDLEPKTDFSKDDLRRLGACLLILANAVLDDLEFGASWQPVPGQSHPPGIQRLMGACVHVNEYFGGLGGGFGVVVFMSVLAALGEIGYYHGPLETDALIQLIADYDHSAVESQYTRLQKALVERGLQ